MLFKKRTYIIVIVCIILIWWLKQRNLTSTLSNESSFKINDKTKITKVFIADRNGNTITLDKKEKNWIVNNKYKVRTDAISTLLSTTERIRIKKPVSKNAEKNVIKFIATTGVTVELFSNDKLIKSYVIGSNTHNHLGTYMLLKGSKQPFVVHIPAFNGFLSPRYGIQGNTLDINSWRSNIVFKLNPDEIKYIRYTDLTNTENSYSLLTSPLVLKDKNNNIVKYNNERILKLLNSFNNLNCETFKENKTKKDLNIQLEELIVNTDTLRTYKIAGDKKTREENFTVARKFATLNNGEVMLLQDYVFNKVLIKINELKK